MATSGVYSLGLTLNELATDSFDILQIGEDGETLDGDMIRRYRNSANLLLKSWQAQGIHLWSYTEGSLFLTIGQSEYDLNTAKSANTYYETTTSANIAASAISFSVTSGSNIQAGDTIGVIGDDNDLVWTTVDRISGTTVWVDDAFSSAITSGAKVRNYRATLIPISRVLNVRRKDDDSEIPIEFDSRKDYFNLPNKDIQGTPIQAYYSRQDVAGENNGVMYLWNAPSSSNPVINFTYERKLQVFTDPDETVDIPDYAQEAFIYQMAVRMIPKYGCSPVRAAFIRDEADRLLNDMLAFDSAVYPIRMKMKRYG